VWRRTLPPLGTVHVPSFGGRQAVEGNPQPSTLGIVRIEGVALSPRDRTAFRTWEPLVSTQRCGTSSARSERAVDPISAPMPLTPQENLRYSVQSGFDIQFR